MPSNPNAVLILSGGAPNSPLVAGALAAIYERGKTFDTIFSSGAGALIGMLFLAPKGNTVPGALRATLNVAIDDQIYKHFPIGYKTFFKPGPFTRLFIQMAGALQITNPAIPENIRRFSNDMIDFWFAAACPTDLNLKSQGLCRPVPFVDDVVDFERLRSKEMQGRFYMNAYSIDEAKTVNFSNEQLTKEYFHAALSFPFIYSPACIDGKHYFEGSSVHPINLHILREMIATERIKHNSFFVLMDLLGAFEGALVRTPNDLLDAFGISIITPVCALARKARKIFELEEPGITLNSVEFDVPDDKKPHMLDWSYSNMTAMWDIGYAAGHKFVDEYGQNLPDLSDFPAPEPVKSDQSA